MIDARDYAPPTWLRGPHVQSVLSSSPLRRRRGARALARLGAQTSEVLLDAGDGVRLQGFHSSLPRPPRGLVLLLHGWEGSVESGYMLHTAAGIPLSHAAAVCPVLDPTAGMIALETGMPLYHWYFMRKWRDSLRRKRKLFPGRHDFEDAALKQGMRGLTTWMVERYTDLGLLDKYLDGYAINGDRLAGLQVPVSILTAEDDPVIPVAAFRKLQLPPHSRLEIAPFGGHCGFLEGINMQGFAEKWVRARLLEATDVLAAAAGARATG